MARKRLRVGIAGAGWVATNRHARCFWLGTTWRWFRYMTATRTELPVCAKASPRRAMGRCLTTPISPDSLKKVWTLST